MSDWPKLGPTRRKILQKIKAYSQKAGELSRQVRQFVFDIRHQPKPQWDRRALPAIISRHRVVQRQRVFKQAGGGQSSAALHALAKARQHQP